AVNYLALGLLWMACAVRSAQGIGWCIPFIFFLIILASWLIKILIHPGTTILLILCPLLAVGCALGCVLAGAHHAESKHPQSRQSAPPRRGILLISYAVFCLKKKNKSRAYASTSFLRIYKLARSTSF